MTFRERFKLEYPHLASSFFVGSCLGCPHQYGYTNERPKECLEETISCAECWDREMPETDLQIMGFCRYYIEKECKRCETRTGGCVACIIEEAESLNPYKVIGRPETYSDYNQGWVDALNFVALRIGIWISKE